METQNKYEKKKETPSITCFRLHRTPIHSLKVGACDSRLVPEMDNNRPVAEEARRSLDQRGVRVDVFVAERILRNLAVLATQVTDLASLRLRLIARRIFAALVGVKVGEGFGAVAAGGHGSNVDMVDCGVRDMC